MLALLSCVPVIPVSANTAQNICLLETLGSAPETMTAAQIREQCNQVLSAESADPETPANIEEKVVEARETAKSEYHQSAKLGAAGRRKALENAAYQNRFALEPHKPNYVLPYTYTRSPNQTPFLDDYNGQLESAEVEFQVSIKATLARGVLFGEGTLYAGYTNHSFWQAYNGKLSRPFRETNHQPEVWVDFDSSYELWGVRNVTNGVGINHQSNGQSGDLSRSWNRVIAHSVWEKDNFAFMVRAWYRIPEDGEDYPGDPNGDDNPDIEDYLGNGEFQSAYSVGNHTISVKLRNYFSSGNRHATEIGWSFPLGKRVGGYIKYFNGYGESLIDYDVKMETLGIGIELNDWL